MSKLAQRVQYEEAPLLAQVLRTKYGKLSRSWENKGKAQSYYVWKGLYNSSKLLADNFSWELGKGNNIYFWFDR